MRVILIGVVGVCASATASWAQPAAPPTEPPSPTAPAVSPGPGSPGAVLPDPALSDRPADASAPASDPAWRIYDDAFARAAGGDRDAASQRLRELSQQWPQHPAAARATSLVRAAEPPGPDAPSRVARGELVFWSTVGGVFTAANICVISGCNSQRETAAVYTLAVGGSLALSLAASRNGVAQGEAQLYNSAQTWGSWNGLAINDGFARDSRQAGTALGAQGAGLLAGIGLWKTWHPTQGDVALTNSFLLWSSVLTIWGHLAADNEPSLASVVIAGDVGILLGALTSTRIKMSRGRTLLIDVGGVLGILGGGLAAIGTQSDTGAGTALLIGTGAGLGIATALTASWDAPPVTVAPTRLTGASGTSTWGISAAFGF